MKTLKQILTERVSVDGGNNNKKTKVSHKPDRGPNYITAIENKEKPTKPFHKNHEYATHHVVWTESGKGYWVHEDEVHVAHGGHGGPGKYRVGDNINADKHRIFYDPGDH